MKFLNSNTYLTETQEKSLEIVLEDIKKGVYNSNISEHLNSSFNVLNIGYKSGYVLYKSFEGNKGSLVGIDTPSGANPSAKETLRFNNIDATLREFDNFDSLCRAAQSFIDSGRIQVVLNNYYTMTENILMNCGGKENVVFFHLEPAGYELVTEKTFRRFRQMEANSTATVKSARNVEVNEAESKIENENYIQIDNKEEIKKPTEKTETKTKKTTRRKTKTKTEE